MSVCAECTYFEFDDIHRKDRVERKYKCSNSDVTIDNDDKHCVWAINLACSYFCETSEREKSEINDAIEEAEEWKVRHESPSYSPCYLTTLTCNLLGMEDNNLYLQTMRDFRDNVMQKDLKYFNLLVQYDVVGPIIAKHLSSDPDKFAIAKELFEFQIKKIVMEIKEMKYDQAIEDYTSMVEFLIDRCKVKKEEELEYSIEDVDVSKSGHGQLILKPKTNLN